MVKLQKVGRRNNCNLHSFSPFLLQVLLPPGIGAAGETELFSEEWPCVSGQWLEAHIGPRTSHLLREKMTPGISTVSRTKAGEGEE